MPNPGLNLAEQCLPYNRAHKQKLKRRQLTAALTSELQRYYKRHVQMLGFVGLWQKFRLQGGSQPV